MLEGENATWRGIRKRIRHQVEGLLLHDAELTPQLQAGHRHLTLHEAVMLLDGEVEACAWDDTGRIETRLLSEWGDLVVFPPERNHTLFVKRDSRVIVVRFPASTGTQDMGERTPMPMPGGLEDLREKTLALPDLTGETRQQIELELERMKG